MSQFSPHLSLTRRAGSISALALAAAAGFGPVTPAQGQTETLNEGDVIEAITVTARRREEDLRDVPLSITAISAEQISQAGIQNLFDIAGFTPGLSFNSFNNGNFAVPTIRGVAQTDITNLENNVAVFFNGVFISNKQTLDLTLLDLERVEVVKGPQNALYGRNAFAGAINYVSASANLEEFEGHAEVTAGSRDTFIFRGSVNVPVNQSLAVRVSGGYSSFDGTIENAADANDNLGGYDKATILGAVTFEPASNFTAEAFFYFNEADLDHNGTYSAENNCGFGLPSFGFTQPVLVNFCGEHAAPSEVDLKPENIGADKESWIAGLSLSWDVTDEISLFSLTSYGESDNFDVGDNDFSSAGTDYRVFAFNPAAGALLPTGATANGQTFTGQEGGSEDFSQELRVEYTPTEMWNVAAGVFYSQTDLRDQLNLQTVIQPDALAPGELISQFGINDTGVFDRDRFAIVNSSDFDFETIGIFGRAEINPLPNLRFSAELRYTREDKSAFLQALDAAAGGAVVDSPGAVNDDFSFITPRITADYQPTEDSMIYATVARGAKGGGFNNTTSPVVEAQRFDEETNWTYEIGARTTLLGGALQLDLAGYYIDWNDLQISSATDANVAVIQNVDGGATVKGFELGLSWALTSELLFRAGYAFSDPTFKDGTFTTAVQARDCGVTSDVLCTIDPTRGYNASGQQLARTSKHQFNANATYTRELTSDLEGFVRGDVNYQSGQFITPLNVATVAERTLVNLRAGLTLKRFTIEGWARNLLNKNHTTSAVRFNLPDQFPLFTNKPFLGERRTFGVTVRAKL